MWKHDAPLRPDPVQDEETDRVDRLLDPAWRWWAVFRAAQVGVALALLALVLLAEACGAFPGTAPHGP